MGKTIVLERLEKACGEVGTISAGTAMVSRFVQADIYSSGATISKGEIFRDGKVRYSDMDVPVKEAWRQIDQYRGLGYTVSDTLVIV